VQIIGFYECLFSLQIVEILASLYTYSNRKIQIVNTTTVAVVASGVLQVLAFSIFV